MTIYEVIKTGRNFRRGSWPTGTYLNSDRGLFDLTTEELSADDWEVEETKVTITGSQFDAAYKQALVDYNDGLELFADCLKRRLGL